MTKKIEEENKNDSKNNKNRIGITEERGELGTGDSGDKGRDLGQSGREVGQSGGQSGGSEDDPKQRILDKLRNERNQRNSQTTNDKHTNSEGDSTGQQSKANGTNKRNNRSSNGTESIGSTDSGSIERSVGDERGLDVDNGNNDGNNPSSETNSRGRKRKIKGVEFELPSFEGGKPTPPIDKKEQQLQKELTKKESNELQPRVENALKALFTGVDKAIDMTTKNRTPDGVHIWGSIEDFEITIIATALLETGQKSKVVSTVTRRLAQDYTRLQLGIIVFPRFYDSYRHYITNGFGFGFSQNNNQITGGQ
jgi:hypothetical protein